MRALVAGLSIALAACGPGPGMGGGADAGAGDFGMGSPEALPASAPARFGFGSEADAARVAMWDVDVRPDGTGLPAGSGTVDQGRQVFETYCLECHGATGIDGPNDRLVGGPAWVDEVPAVRTIGNYWQYSTTLYDFIRRGMPQMTPGLLSADQTYAVIAYLLYLNQIVPEDAVMDTETRPAVVMPARDKFVLDDRAGGSGPVR
jgi:cytochrome c